MEENTIFRTIDIFLCGLLLFIYYRLDYGNQCKLLNLGQISEGIL